VQLAQLERLAQEVEGPEPERVSPALELGRSRDQHDRHVGVVLEDAIQ
jgi:hypothetical protein